MEIEIEETEQEKNIPLLCEFDRKPFAVPKNLGPCIIQGCTRPTKYACPKCKCNYCSLDCYKNHNDQCINKFYEENVKEELKNRKADEKTQKKMREMLKEYKDQLDQDREEYEIPQQKLDRLEELERMMIENELDLDFLTIEEQKDFTNFIQNNAQLQKYLKPWNAWWLIEDGLFSLYVEELSSNDSNIQTKNQDILEVIDFRKKMKQRIQKQISFQSLCKVAPHQDLPFQLINILCGTIFTLRLFNGDIWENPLEPLNLLVSISYVNHIFSLILYSLPFLHSKLKEQKILQMNKEQKLKWIQSITPNNRIEVGSVYNAINDVISNALRIDSQNTKKFIPLLQEDMIAVFKNKVFMIEILYRLYDLLHEVIYHVYLKILSQLEIRDIVDEANEGTAKNNQKENMKVLGNIKQKLIFFISYTKDVLNQEQLSYLVNGIIEFKQDKEQKAAIDSKIGEMKKLNLLL